MLRATSLSLFLFLILGAVVVGTASASSDDGADPISEAPATLEADQAVEQSCEVLDAASSEILDSKREAGFFGPHCGSSFTCTVVDEGIGFGDCTCVYECDCAYCTNVWGETTLAQINCQLVANNGCLACRP